MRRWPGFRRRHQEAIAALFAQAPGLCVDAGLVHTDLVAIDGAKLAADVSFFANRTREERVAGILEEAECTEAGEDERFGDSRGDELPGSWGCPRDRRARIRAALDELERQGSRDYETRMAERAAKEAALGRRLTSPPPTRTPARPKGPGGWTLLIRTLGSSRPVRPQAAAGGCLPRPGRLQGVYAAATAA